MPGQGSEEPRAPLSAPRPQTQTPTYSSTESCHGNHTVGQAGGATSSAADSPPVTSPSSSQDIQGESLGCITCPWDARCTST